MEMWLGIIIVVAVLAVLMFKGLARRSFGNGREPQSLTNIHAPIQDQVSLKVLEEVWSKVGEAFAIDPRLIRPTDTLKSLARIDSWDLGEGGDALGRWLQQMQLGKPPSLETMLDLVKWVQEARGDQHGRA